ncbi:rhomboid family intramembrane serine protease [Aurantibacter sp.]|uniref:rhomboid family intramembrane serine protease n=1 Tax=Aurantibacter sp. TaxID=2807103 RepID=UPI0035C7D98C
MMRITETVKHLLIINIIFFAGAQLIGGGELFYDLFALYFPENDAFKPWQIVTHMFMHGGLMHLVFNMFALWMFGSTVEARLGRNKFLFVYFSAGLGAILFQVGYNYFDFTGIMNDLIVSGFTKSNIIEMITTNKVSDSVSPIQLSGLQDAFSIYNGSMVGASGCLMGILVAFGMLNPNAELMMLFLPIPIKAKYFIPGIILLDVISAFSGQSFFSPSNTAYLAHVGGAVVGFIIMWYWKKNSFNSFRIN